MDQKTDKPRGGSVFEDYVRKNPPPVVSPTDKINTKGILHFTLSVRDHVAAAKFYTDVLGGVKLLRTSDKFSFMECHGSYFVLAKMPNHVNPNLPDDESYHTAFLVDEDEFDHAMEVLIARKIPIKKYSDKGHRSFAGRHAYFHDADGNSIEIIYLYPDGKDPAPKQAGA